MPWPAAQSGKSDIVMAGVTVNEDRLLIMDFTDSPMPPAYRWSSSPRAPMSPWTTWASSMIGTQRGTTGYIYC